MNTFFALIFWIAAALMIYHLFGYPLLLAVAARFGKRPARRAPFTPLISVIVAAHNEQAVTRQKPVAILESCYPPGQLEVILAGDGSTEGALQEALSIDDPRLIVDYSPVRQSQMSALNRAIRRAHGKHLVISDATAVVQPDAPANLRANFVGAQAAAFTGLPRFSSDNQTVLWRKASG